MPDPRRPDETEPIADAASLFDTGEVRPYMAPSPPPSAAPAPAVADGYDLEADPFAGRDEPPRPAPIPEPVERPRARPEPPRPRTRPETETSRPEVTPTPSEGSGSIEYEAEGAVVDPVWTRGAEWGPDLVRVGLAAAATMFLAWATSGNLLLCLALLAAGGAASAVLCYPMLITLERPVRITPEQAVTDFFAAASHRFPSYRRMWLLLSEAGRKSGPFRTFDDFRGHWKGRIDRWKAGQGAGLFSPLTFAVEDFRADKSTGKTTSRADYTVHVSLRDGDAGPIESFQMAHGLVKGPDRMWYLNQGKLSSRAR